MIRNKIKYRFYFIFNTFLFEIGFENLLLKNKYGERILLFHGIDKVGETKYNSRFHSKTYFEKFIKYISENYNIISLDDYYQKKFKPNTLNIAITFDDGYINNYKYAIPILQKHLIPATFFITTVPKKSSFLWADYLDLVSYYSLKKGFFFEDHLYKKNKKNEFIFNGISLKNRCKKLDFKQIEPLFTVFEEEWKIIQNMSLNDYWELMTEKEIKQIARNPIFTISSHSCTHANLAEISIEEAKSEILKGKKTLESICKAPISEFAFPFGTYNLELVNFCKEIGFNKILLIDYNTNEDLKNITLKNRFVMNPHINFKMQLLYLLKGKYI